MERWRRVVVIVLAVLVVGTDAGSGTSLGLSCLATTLKARLFAVPVQQTEDVYDSPELLKRVVGLKVGDRKVEEDIKFYLVHSERFKSWEGSHLKCATSRCTLQELWQENVIR